LPTGLGKSEQARIALADYVRRAKTMGIPHQALVYVPTHRLAEEARRQVPNDISTALWQSRKANDVATGAPLCSNLRAVEAAETIGLNVERTACRRGRRGQKPILCSFYHECRYQAQKAAAKKADIIFCAHEYLFNPPSELKQIGIVVVDESFWQDGLSFSRIAVDGLGAELGSFPARQRNGKEDLDGTIQLSDLIFRLQRAVKVLLGWEPGTPFVLPSKCEYLTKAALEAEGLVAADGENERYFERSGVAAAKLEWARKVKVDLAPDSSEDVIKSRVHQFGFLGQLPKRAAMWRAVQELLSGSEAATGRLRTEIRTTHDGSVLYLRLNGRREIHKRITAVPIIVLDATLDIEIIRYYLPSIELELDLKVRRPHERITQVIGLPVGKSSLLQLGPGKRTQKEESRVDNKRQRLLETVRRLAAGRRCLVITHKELEPLFFDSGPNIEVAHFNAIEGIDSWRDVEVLVTIGRPLPSPTAVEDIAAALTGKPVSLPLYPSARPGGRPQSMIAQDRPIQLRGGAEVMLPCRIFEQQEAELVRRAVTEAAIVQAVGRARGVNRSSANPVDVWIILNDAVVPIQVDGVVEFGNLEPNRIDLMIERGLVPAWSADAAKLYPDLWPTAQAARKAYSRDGLDVERNRRRSVTEPYKDDDPTPNTRSVTGPYRYLSIRKSHTPLIRYQPEGQGQKPRLAMAEASNLLNARPRIEAVLGELALFEIITDERELNLTIVQWDLLAWRKPGSTVADRASMHGGSGFWRSHQGHGRLRLPQEVHQCFECRCTPA
jgi:putative DNA primase/helicase